MLAKKVPLASDGIFLRQLSGAYKRRTLEIKTGKKQAPFSYLMLPLYKVLRNSLPQSSGLQNSGVFKDRSDKLWTEDSIVIICASGCSRATNNWRW